jgi:hypothetical protein
MEKPVPFPARQTNDDTTRPTPSLADKMQRLVLLHPIAAAEVEKLIDRLLAGD